MTGDDKHRFAEEIRTRVADVDPASIWHVLPTDDIRPHREGMDCECQPRLITVPPAGAVIVHNAWDGREAYE